MKQRIVFAIVMSCVLTFLMSAWVTFINIGMIEGFFNRWMSAWLLAWPAAGIISFTFGPSIHRWSREVDGAFPFNGAPAAWLASAMAKFHQKNERRVGTTAEKIDQDDDAQMGVK